MCIRRATRRAGRRACAGIVRHYNEGWAGGFRYGIRYWEIWNEPENRPVMWTGTDAQFLELYQVTARTLRAEFPTIKIGGPAFGYYGKFDGTELQPSRVLRRVSRPLPARVAAVGFLLVALLHGQSRRTRRPRPRGAPCARRARLHENREPSERMESPPRQFVGRAFAHRPRPRHASGPPTRWLAHLRRVPGRGAHRTAGRARGRVQLLPRRNRHLRPVHRSRRANAELLRDARLCADARHAEARAHDRRRAWQTRGGRRHPRRKHRKPPCSWPTWPASEDIRLSFAHLPWEGATAVEVRIVDGQRAFEPLAGQALAASELTLKLPPPSVALVTLRPQAPK